MSRDMNHPSDSKSQAGMRCSCPKFLSVFRPLWAVVTPCRLKAPMCCAFPSVFDRPVVSVLNVLSAGRRW